MQIYLQPSGLVSISGIASATPFLKGFFDRWHVQPQFVTREEYKNVINQFTQVLLNPCACCPVLPGCHLIYRPVR